MISEWSNMESILSIQDQYLNAVASILTANQYKQQQQQQQVILSCSDEFTSHRNNNDNNNYHCNTKNPSSLLISTSANRNFHRRRFRCDNRATMKQTLSILEATTAPLDLSTRRSTTSPPLSETLKSISLMTTIPQSSSSSLNNTNLPLDLVTIKQSSEHQTSRLISSSTTHISCAGSNSLSSSRPSSVNSSISSNVYRPGVNSSSYCQDDNKTERSRTSDPVISSSIVQQQGRKKSSSSYSKKATKGTKSHLCNHCGRSFSRSDMLTRHSRLHSGLKPYQCAKCLQVFSRSDHLSTHERTHTGEKPYQCNFCSYSACRRDMITRHMRTHSIGDDKKDAKTEVFNKQGKRGQIGIDRSRRTVKTTTSTSSRKQLTEMPHHSEEHIDGGQHYDEDVSTSFDSYMIE